MRGRLEHYFYTSLLLLIVVSCVVGMNYFQNWFSQLHNARELLNSFFHYVSYGGIAYLWISRRVGFGWKLVGSWLLIMLSEGWRFIPTMEFWF